MKFKLLNVVLSHSLYVCSAQLNTCPLCLFVCCMYWSSKSAANIFGFTHKHRTDHIHTLTRTCIVMLQSRHRYWSSDTVRHRSLAALSCGERQWRWLRPSLSLQFSSNALLIVYHAMFGLRVKIQLNAPRFVVYWVAKQQPFAFALNQIRFNVQRKESKHWKEEEKERRRTNRRRT